MGRMSHGDTRIAEEAATWVGLLQDPDAENLVPAFHRWLSQSPGHRTEYALALRALRRLDVLRTLSPSAAAAWLGRSFPARATNILPFPVMPLGPALKTSHASRRVAFVTAVAAMLLVAITAFFWSADLSAASTEYKTLIGQTQELQLQDGTKLVLNTDTHVKVTFTAQARAIELLAGEVVVDVGSDPRRLSLVSGRAVIRDIGTRFAVRRLEDTTSVLVTEGIVQVTYSPLEQSDNMRWSHLVSAELHAGESVSVGPESVRHPPIVGKMSAEEVQQRLAWQKGLVYFVGDTLEAVVAEFNRFNERKMRIVDSELKAIRLGGTFSATDPDEFVRSLPAIGIQVSAHVVDGPDSQIIELRTVD